MTTKLLQEFSVPFKYEVSFSRNIFSPENTLLADTIRSQTTHAPAKVLIILDDGLMPHYPHLIEKINHYFNAFQAIANLTRSPMLVAGGEKAKNTHEYVDQILEAINEDGIDRHALTIAIGGGAVLDMAGYASSIAHRGVRHIRIPTTVLSQNDSGVGVKNAINYFGKKNFIGCFDPPKAVINDLTFLQTLDDRDWRSGISEAVKVALIKDLAFFEFLEQHSQDFNERDLTVMEKQIIRCAELHMEHISSGDPFEMGSSRPLDFGHWAAHKLEQLTDYEVRHGEAVAIGISLDTTYSYLKGMISQADWSRVIQLFKNLGFDIFHPALELTIDQKPVLLEGLREFREHLGGQLTIMLLESLGRGKEVHEMDEDLILKSMKALKEIKNLSNSDVVHH